jgi:hypothetical protein
MTSKYSIEVTKEDIDGATRSDSSHCVIADAIARSVGHRRVHVDLQTITFSDPAKRQRLTYLTPEICQDHLLAFDQGEAVHPFTFTLGRPIQIRKMVSHGGGKTASTVEARNAKFAELQAKRDAGEVLTSGEKGGLTRMEKVGVRTAETYEPKEVRTYGRSERPIVRGGRPLPKAVLSNGKGRVRKYGLRQAKPGVAG